VSPLLPGLEVLEYGFMQRALLAGVLVAAIAGALGVFLVLRGSAMIGDGLAHVAFSGVAVGLLTGLYPLGLALAFAVAGGVGIQLLRQRGVVLTDTAIAIFFTTGLAFGVLVVSLAGGFSVDLFSYLFGSLALVSGGDVWMVAALGAALLALVALLRKELLYITFSEEAARVSGLPVNALNLAFTVLTALTIVVAARVVGILLVSALLVVPAATSLQLAHSFGRALVLSMALGVAAVLLGLYAAFAAGVAAGGAIALVSVLGFFAVLAARRLARAARGG
jgi:zinc transport system permease protein